MGSDVRTLESERRPHANLRLERGRVGVDPSDDDGDERRRDEQCIRFPVPTPRRANIGGALPFDVRHAIAFRWRPPEPAAQDDVARVVERAGVRVALLANGFECGFSACWPPASRRMLDLLSEEWVTSDLSVAFERARARFVEGARSLLGSEPEFPDDEPSAVLLAVAVSGESAHAAWIGGDVAVLVRDGRVVSSTTPHTLREEYLRGGGERELVDQLPNVLARQIGSADTGPVSTLSMPVRAGDTLVLLSRAVFHGPCVSPERVAFEAQQDEDPAALAERLAELGFASSDTPYAAVIVLRLGER